MNPVAKKKGIQRQLRWLLTVLVGIAAINAFVFLVALYQLIDSYKSAARAQKIAFLAGDLERSFFEENKLREAPAQDSSDESDFGRETLADVRSKIRGLLHDLRGAVSDRASLEQVKLIEKKWRGAHDEGGTRRLLKATKDFVAGQEKGLIPLQAAAESATRAVTTFLFLYLIIFAMTIVVIDQFLKRRVLFPLDFLSEKMKNFQAGLHDLPPPTQRYDEIGDLEQQFYFMAGRVSHTVTELKELDQIKTDFISVVSHELRTPMTAVKGSLSLILSGSLPDLDKDIKDLLVIAEKETDRLIRLINDILDLTKMEAKQLPLEKKLNSVGTVVKEAVAGLSGLLEVTQVSVKIVDTKKPIKVYFDHDRIQQVITNLLSNAVKFSPPKSTVFISYEAYPNPDRHGTLIKIKDSGKGIKSEDIPHLFEKFRSTDSGRSKVIKGTGLGLPICKALVEQHGGQIGVESVAGAGSTFYFTLPEVEEAEDSVSQEVA